MRGIKFNKEDLTDFHKLCRILFPEYISVEFTGSLGSSSIIFRKAPKNSLINLIASAHVRHVIGLLEFALTTLPKRMSQAKARNDSFVPEYLFETFAILASEKPEYILRYFVKKFQEIKEPLNQVSFDEIMENIRDSKIGSNFTENKSLIGRIFNLDTEATPSEVRIIKIVKSKIRNL